MECNACKKEIGEDPYSNFMGIYLHKKCFDKGIKKEFPELDKLINNK